jgi:hypothetical protein
MTYGFIVCTAIHVILIYTHHGAAQDVAQQVSTGVARGQIIDRARKDAEKQLEVETANLARSLTTDIVESVRRDLQLPIPADPRMPFLPAEPKQYQQALPFPTEQSAPKEAGEQPSPFLKSNPE